MWTRASNEHWKCYNQPQQRQYEEFLCYTNTQDLHRNKTKANSHLCTVWGKIVTQIKTSQQRIQMSQGERFTPSNSNAWHLLYRTILNRCNRSPLPRERQKPGIDAITRFVTTSHDVPNFQKDCLLEAMTQDVEEGYFTENAGQYLLNGKQSPH